MLAIGNGESRRQLSLSKSSVGCNALHRDFEVDHLVCVDRRCLLEALNGPNTETTKIYTRKEWFGTIRDVRVHLVPELPYQGNNRADDPWHWGSGPFAVLLAAQLDDVIDLVGFDLYSSNNLINNIYKNTKNYSQADKKSVDPSYWIYQISKIFQCYPHKYFTVYNESNWLAPESWRLANVKFETLDKYRSK